MSADTYDVIVVGCGAMGSAALYHLAKGGRRVLGLDRYYPPHDHGSSHGRTRIIREAYFEDPAYVPLVRRAYQLWGELEAECGEELLRITGGLMIGLSDGPIVAGALASARLHRLPYESLTEKELAARFPCFRAPAGSTAVYESRAGILFPERCVGAHLRAAERSGAVIRCGAAVDSWGVDHGRAWVRAGEETFESKKLILCAGAWMSGLEPSLPLPLEVERQIFFWFRAADGATDPAKLPIFLFEIAPGRFYYGFPDLGDGIKVARYHEGETGAPDRIRREVTSSEVESMRELLRATFPQANGTHLASSVCMFTNTPDGHFIIDRHPEYSHVILVSPCSGHGFKFSSAIGEITARLAADEDPGFDLDLFRLGRFNPS